MILLKIFNLMRRISLALNKEDLCLEQASKQVFYSGIFYKEES